MFPSIRHAFRILRRDASFTVVAIVSLALGIGATTAIFSFADSMLLRPLPVREPSRIVTINTAVSAPFGQNPPISYPDYVDLRDRNTSFDGLVAASYTSFGFSPNNTTLPRVKSGLIVSGNFFRVLGVEPALGRGFRSEEDRVEGRDAVAVLGHDFWVGQFGARRSVVGSHIRLNGIEFTVIGVAPAQFTGIDTVMRPQIFVPIAMSPRTEERNYLHDRNHGWLFIKGRLKPGVTLEQAQADVAALSAQLERLHQVTTRDLRLRVETELELRTAQLPTQTGMLVMLALLAICVLMVACANVAGLLLSRARGRAREIAVRLAIGAGRAALVRQLLLENLIIAAAGGLASLWVADLVAEFLRRIPVPSELPIVFEVGVDHRVLLCTLVVSLVSTLLFGLAPALGATRPDLVPALKAADADSGGKRRLWGRHTIVAGQVALSLVLLAISAALVEGFRHQLLQGPGYRIDHLFLASFDTHLAHYSPSQEVGFYRELLDRMRAEPGIRSAALSSYVPMEVFAEPTPVAPEGWELPRGEQAINTLGACVTEGYFETMGIPILYGRGFRESDKQDAPLVAVVNEQMAEHYWKGNALGQRFHLGKAGDPLIEIVGMAKMSKYFWVAEQPMDFVYMPSRQHPHAGMSLIAESAAPDAATLAPVIRDAVRKLDPDMPLFQMRTMRDLYTGMGIGYSNVIIELVGGMGLLGVILATVGLYGVVAYSVSRRTREIGIRMALGAGRRAVVRMVLWQGLRLGLWGVAAGLLFAHYACRIITSALALPQINALVYFAVPLPLLLITILAAWAPARRAARVDPLTSLHDE